MPSQIKTQSMHKLEPTFSRIASAALHICNVCASSCPRVSVFTEFNFGHPLRQRHTAAAMPCNDLSASSAERQANPDNKQMQRVVMCVCKRNVRDAQCTQAQHQSPHQRRARSRTRIPRTVVCKSHNEAHRLFTHNSTVSVTVAISRMGVIIEYELFRKRKKRKRKEFFLPLRSNILQKH